MFDPFRGTTYEQMQCINQKSSSIIREKCQIDGIKVGSGCKQGPHFTWYKNCRSLAFETARQQCGLPAMITGTFDPPSNLGGKGGKGGKKKKLLLIAIDDDEDIDEYIF